MFRRFIPAVAACMAALLLTLSSARAEEDKFAKCPDPQAAREYVKQCLAANPYKTKEVCEELALEKACKSK
jgi:hypothetical protein